MYLDMKAAVPNKSSSYAFVQNDDAIVLELPPLRLVAGPDSDEYRVRKFAFKTSAYGWELEPSLQLEDYASGVTRDRLGLKATHAGPQWEPRSKEGPYNEMKRGGREYKIGGLKLGFELGLWLRNLRFILNAPYINGKVDPARVVLLLYGLEELVISLWSGAEDSHTDNIKIRIEVPVELIRYIPPSPPMPVPLVTQIKFKFYVETFLGGKNATLTAQGNYKLNGPLGMEGGKVVIPTLEEKQAMVNSMGGISLDASGVVLATEIRFLVGLGTPVFIAGPYSKFIGSLGLTRGSVLGFAPVCSKTTLKFDAAAGIGAQFTKKFLPNSRIYNLIGEKMKTEFEMEEIKKEIWKPIDSASPDIPRCR